MLNKNKEYAVNIWLDMTQKSWTWQRMTPAERENFTNGLNRHWSKEAIIGTFDHRWNVLQAMYGMYLNALGYNRKDSFRVWREREWTIAENFEQFIFERGEYCFPPDDTIRWIVSMDREKVTYYIFCELLLGKIKPIINYLESELAVIDEDDDSKEYAELIISVLKEG